MRQKAETQLQQSKALISDLQNQLSELQEHEQKTIQLRHELTISRLPAHEKHHMQKEVASIGKEFLPDPDSVPPEQEKKISVAKGPKGKAVAPSKTELYDARTTLTKVAKAGDTTLKTESHASFKKGMIVIVGMGSHAETHVVDSFGSIVIEEALAHTHPAGATIYGFQNNSKGIANMHYVQAQQLVRGIIYEELIPQAVGVGGANLLSRELNDEYANRPMLRHIYTMSAKNAVSFDSDSVVQSLCASPSVSQVMVAAGGSMQVMELGYAATDFTFLFASLQRAKADEEEADWDKPKRDSQWPWDKAGEVYVADLLAAVYDSASARGAFQTIVEFAGFGSLEELLAKYSHDRHMEGATIGWASYCRMIRMIDAVSEHVEVFSEAASKPPFERQAMLLLIKIFDLTDTDGDETITSAETARVFAKLDGAATDVESYQLAIQRAVGGGTSADAKFTDLVFLKVREEYARLTRTLFGGVCLHGRVLLREQINALRQGDADVQDTAIVPLPNTMVNPSELMARLPDALLDATILSTGQKVSMTFDSAPFGKAISALELEDVCSALQRVGGAPSSRTSWAIGGGHSSQKKMKYVIMDNSGKTTLTMAMDGVIHVFDTASGAELCSNRVIWCEPSPTRAVEGYEKFLKWRQDVCIDVTDPDS